MQREIKFRAWDIESKCYTKDEFLISGCYKNEIQVLGISMDREAECMNDEVVLEQFSGLKDKIGNDIFEGDIVNYPIAHIQHINRVGLVIFDRGMFAVEWKNTTWIGIKNSLLDYSILTTVVGNIHEHPELLNG